MLFLFLLLLLNSEQFGVECTVELVVNATETKILTRFIQKLTGLDYEDANRLLFEVVEYVEPRMKSDQAYPPVVGLAVVRHRHNLSNEQAEWRLKNELG